MNKDLEPSHVRVPLHYRLWQVLAKKKLGRDRPAAHADVRPVDCLAGKVRDEVVRLKWEAGEDLGSAQGPFEPGCHRGVIP